MTPPLSDSSLLLPPFQDGAKPHPDPGVQRRERLLAAVFEVLEPASQRGIEAFEDGRHAVAIATPSELSDSVLEARKALVARAPALSHQVVAEEIEPLPVSMHHPRLLGMEREAEIGCTASGFADPFVTGCPADG